MAKAVILAFIFLVDKTLSQNSSETTESVTSSTIEPTTISISTASDSNSTIEELSKNEVRSLKPSGRWHKIQNHELAGGLVRVTGDGPKREELADPKTDIGWDPPLTGEMVMTHPNYDYLSPTSECGQAVIQEEQYDREYDIEDVPDETVDDENITNITNTTSDDFGKREKRIVGGKVVRLQTHPWMVQLYLYNVSSGEHSFHCAGTLISTCTVMTAAHCMTRIQPGYTMDVLVIGNVDRRKIKFCKTNDPNEPCSRANLREIEDFEVHEGYNEGNLNNDIALIYLKKPIKVNANARPICLPYTSRLLEYWTDLKLTAPGWGATNQHPSPGNYLSDVLKQVEIDLQPRSLCDKYHVRIYGKVKASKICTAGNTGRASCNGDSGGAVVKTLTVPDIEQGKLERVFQFGIVSAGGHPVDTCGFQGRPAIDTNVFYFMEWILNHITPGVASYRYQPINTPSGSTPGWVLSDTDKGSGVSGVPVQELGDVKTEVNPSGNLASKHASEFSTGQLIDVTLHPNIGLLPHFNECGNLPSHQYDSIIATPMRSHHDHSTTTKPPRTTEKSELSPENGEPDIKPEDNRRRKRIVGGLPLSLENYYPWMAQIYIRNAETNDLGFHCSGTIISSRNILTGAHCVTELISPFVFDSIVVGQYNRNNTRECLNQTCFSPIRVKILDVVVHSEYEKYSHKNNLALVRLGEDLEFTRMVQPICLPHREALVSGLTNERFFTAGWGRLTREREGPTDKMSAILLQMYIDILKRRDCDFVYSRTIDMLDRSRVCGGGNPSQGECLGDGGSPLMKRLLLEPNHPLHNKIFQFGIVSFSDCGMQGMPTVYTNIIYYMNWLLDNLTA